MISRSLARDGFVVVKNVLSKDECAGIRKEVLQGNNVHNHSDLMWKIRTHERVVKVFQECWNTPENMLSSFDGFSHGLSSELDWHVDINLSQPFSRMVSLQAILSIESIDSETGGTLLLRGSHKHAHDICTRFSTDDRSDEWQITWIDEAEEPSFRTCSIVQPQLSSGDMLLWDSRTAHKVKEGLGEKARMVFYLSMVPECFVDEETRKERMHMFKNGTTSTHWVQCPIHRSDGPVPSADLQSNPKVLAMI